jgi:serine/threonine protein phosphatase PrpC
MYLTSHQANAGDSRGVLSVNGVVKPLSFDHKPGNECPSCLNSPALNILT